MSDQLEPELERVARMLAEAGPLPDAPAALRERALAVPDGGPVADADLTAAAARRPRRRLRLRPAALLGVAAVVAAIAIVPTALLLRGDGAGQGQSIDMAPRPFAPNGGGTANVVSHDDGSATIHLRVWKMPRPGAGRAYELWLGRKGDRYAVGTFGIDSSGAANVSLEVPPGEIGNYRWLWVTSEPAGGSDTPSERTALWAALT